jgi:hypothetical protein
VTGEALFSTVTAFRYDEFAAALGCVWENARLKPYSSERMVGLWGQWSAVGSEPSKPARADGELPLNEWRPELCVQFAEAHRS